MSDTYALNKWERIYDNFLIDSFLLHGTSELSDHCFMVIERWQKEYDVYIEADFKLII